MTPKTVTNNEIAALSNMTAVKRKDREIMTTPDVIGKVHIVSLDGPKWAGPVETNPSDKVLWDFNACDLPFAWSHYGVRGEGINVFVLDSGIDQFHPSFAGKSVTAKSFVPSTDVQDGCGHGTWVCGKIVGAGVGIAPKCNLFSLKVLDDSGSGTVDFTNNALSWILSQPITPHVVNMSLGSPQKSTAQEKLIWQLYKKGCIVVVASGNQGKDDSTFYPAAYAGTVAVAALDKNKSRATFSNFGADIAVSAPGVACYSAFPGGAFRLLEGTSMAAPTVAGLITLGLSYASSKANSPLYLRDLITSSLEESAQDLGTLGRDPYYGFGCIDGKSFFAKLDQKLGN